MMSNDQRPAAPKPKSNPLAGLAGMGAAWLLIGAVIIGVALGLGIDYHFNSMPWATLGSSLLFMAAGIYLVIREGSR
jgi:F0F1-type ATP synthase assembly protein I